MFYYKSHDCTGGRGPRGKFRRGPFVMSWDFDVEGLREAFVQGGGRRRRQFDSFELRLVLLALISDAPRHGYDLIREIEDRTGGAYAPSPGVVYPTLGLLADQGYIAEQESEGARKLYGVTPEGEAHLAENAEKVTELMGRLAELGVRRERTERGSVRRAMGNLRHVLANRLHDELDEEILHSIVETIDEAARKIERM
jgi:DNA-binding PadR family transcriptional regulator